MSRRRIPKTQTLIPLETYYISLIEFKRNVLSIDYKYNIKINDAR